MAEVRAELVRLVIKETEEQQAIVLREVDGDRELPIMIGIWEAFAIDRGLRGRKTPRPMTHDLVGNVLEALGAKLERVIVTDLRDGTFYANLVVRADGKEHRVDSRPSDAIALSVLLDVPIFVEERVLDEAALHAQENQIELPEPPEQDEQEESDPEDPGFV
jgi:bifunctional DNase/RNase